MHLAWADGVSHLSDLSKSIWKICIDWCNSYYIIFHG